MWVIIASHFTAEEVAFNTFRIRSLEESKPVWTRFYYPILCQETSSGYSVYSLVI